MIDPSPQANFSSLDPATACSAPLAQAWDFPAREQGRLPSSQRAARYIPPHEDPSEQEIAWRAYSTRAMLPSFTVCLLATVLLLTGVWYVEPMHRLAEAIGTIFFFALTLAVWLIQFLRWLYRVTTYTYRITDRHIHIDKGFLYRPIAPVAWSEIQDIQWGGTFLDRWMGVGWVKIRTRSGRRVKLSGVYDPARLASDLKRQTDQAAAGNLNSCRV